MSNVLLMFSDDKIWHVLVKEYINRCCFAEHA